LAAIALTFFDDCPEAKTCTLLQELRDDAEQFIAEVEGSLSRT
jgi:hypothetical protein